MRLSSLTRNAILFTIGSSVLLAACGGASESNGGSSNGANATSRQAGGFSSGHSSSNVEPTPTAAKATGDHIPPVEFASHGLSADKKTVSFSITSPKDITRYRVTTRYSDASGKVVATVINGTGNTGEGAKVIVKANTPTELKVTADNDPAIVGVDAFVAELHFADGTSWKLGQ